MPEEQSRLSLLNELINERCLQLLSLQDGEKVIDIGSGLGQFTIAMARQVGPKGYCLGIERDENQLITAKKNQALCNDLHWVEFRQGDVTQLPLDPHQYGSFDIGHARFVLEHLSRPESALAELTKSVRTGGRVVVADDDHVSFLLHPDPPGFSAIWTAYMRSYDRLGNDPYIGRRLVSLLYDCGLRSIRNDVVFFGDCSGSATFNSYVSNLIGILESAREIMVEGNLIDSVVMDEALANLRRWALLPRAALWYQIYWAEGIKI